LLRTLIVVACLLILVSFPHALEDFHYGDLARFGVSLPFGIIILVALYSLQLEAIISILMGNPRAALLLAATGAIWCVGAIVIHGHDVIFAGPGYRHGLSSRLLELCIIILGALVAIVGIRVAQQGRNVNR
jgi:hypothetical protein